MDKSAFRESIIAEFPFVPTKDQLDLINGLVNFTISDDYKQTLILKGYAGTGKTTVISAYVNKLWAVKKKFKLIAPTGRAAKVIASYSGKSAFTIHRLIYRPKKSKDSGVNFIRQSNKHKDTIFIVDEASMISDSISELNNQGQNSLLDDLMEFVAEGVRCKLVLVGDDAQLPPVNSTLSPALDSDNIYRNYDLSTQNFQLTEVLRQEIDSGILYNATLIRECINNFHNQGFQFNLNNQKEVIRLIDGYEIESAISSCYSNYSIDETTIIVRSNKRANLYNQQIRSRIRLLENEISAGDILMVVKNNYFWLDSNSKPGFIANGDSVEVLSISKIQDLYGFRFADVELKLVDYPDEPSFSCIILLNTLTVDGPSLSYDDSNRLYQNVKEDYQDEKSNYMRYKKIKEDPYFNALQVKFAYAVTCHKSQGGQWENVFVEQAWLPEDKIDIEYLRWLYTAVTRAKSNLYLIGFKDSYFTE